MGRAAMLRVPGATKSYQLPADRKKENSRGGGLEVERFRFLRIAIPVPWGILEELDPELESKE